MTATVTWSIYLLKSGNRTYVGATTDPARRLRQHNGELVGGARATRSGRPWVQVCWLSGFDTRSTAYRWEKLLKLRASGVYNRKLAMELIFGGVCPPGRKEYPVPEGLEIHYVLPYTPTDPAPTDMPTAPAGRWKSRSRRSRKNYRGVRYKISRMLG